MTKESPVFLREPAVGVVVCGKVWHRRLRLQEPEFCRRGMAGGEAGMHATLMWPLTELI